MSHLKTIKNRTHNMRDYSPKAMQAWLKAVINLEKEHAAVRKACGRKSPQYSAYMKSLTNDELRVLEIVGAIKCKCAYMKPETRK